MNRDANDSVVESPPAVIELDHCGYGTTTPIAPRKSRSVEEASQVRRIYTAALHRSLPPSHVQPDVESIRCGTTVDVVPARLEASARGTERDGHAANHVSSRRGLLVVVKQHVRCGRLYAQLTEHADDLAAVQRAVIHHVHHDLPGGKAGVTDEA